MPEIKYMATVNLMEEYIHTWASFSLDVTGRNETEKAKILACRQWVAENPEYPNGTIVVAEINGSTAVLEQVEGEWWYAETAEALGEAFLKSGTPPVVVVRVLHTPPSMRDHLYAIGLDDEMISDSAGNDRSLLVATQHVIKEACREAER